MKEAMGAGTVLVVDDDPDIRETVTDCLEDEGYRVTAAADGAQGLAAAAREPPDVILLDMKMPVLDGWEFARRYHALPEHPARIVCMTAAADVRQRCRDIGADGCLSKPFSLAALYAAVAHPRHGHS
jgi:urea transport system substrate-binding protein